MANNVLLYNKKVRGFGMPQGVLNIGEHWEAIDKKCMVLIQNLVILFKIKSVHFMVMHRAMKSFQSTDKKKSVHSA